MTFFYDLIQYDANVHGKELHVRVRGDVHKDFVFVSTHNLNEPLALLTAHICSIPFQIQAKKCVVTPDLEHEKMKELVRIFRANLSTYLSLYPDYPNDIHVTSLDQHDAKTILTALKTVHIKKIERPAIAVSMGKESLLGYHLLKMHHSKIGVYTVNNPNALASHVLRCPLTLTRAPVYAPSGWRQDFNMTLPWRLFLLASMPKETDWLIFGDEFETNQCFELSKNRFFFADDFDQSVYVSGLINSAARDVTGTRLGSLVGNLCEMQIQGIIDTMPAHIRNHQISCWTDTRWCCDCAKCNRFSMLFEALRGVPDPLPAMSLRFIDRMDTVRMWNYCHALKGNARYEASSFFAPGRKSLDLIRLMIKHRRGMPCISMPTDFLTEFQTSRDFPMIETPFNSWLAERLGIFETSVRRAFSRSKRT
jgi:hypothetical protein